MADWVSASDSLPEDYMAVVVAWRCLLGFAFRYEGDWFEIPYGKKLERPPTHWLPISDPPCARESTSAPSSIFASPEVESCGTVETEDAT